MKVNIDTARTTAFALKYRLLGYKLMQNPKYFDKAANKMVVSDPNEVTMIKTWFGLPDGGKWGECVDKCYHYHRIHRYKDGNNVINDKVFLITKYFMDPETKTYPSKRKNYDGYIIKNGKFNPIGKENVTLEDANRRPSPVWLRDGFDSPIERYEFESKLFKQNKRPGYYLPHSGLMEQLLFLCFKFTGYNPIERPFEPSFWHILRTNLNGGGIVK